MSRKYDYYLMIVLTGQPPKPTGPTRGGWAR